MVDSCHKKCIAKDYHDAEMNKGESVCTDRCVAKYFAVSAIINTKFTAANQAAAGPQ
jgi:import inner membrane translocase subunit TIM10